MNELHGREMSVLRKELAVVSGTQQQMTQMMSAWQDQQLEQAGVLNTVRETQQLQVTTLRTTSEMVTKVSYRHFNDSTLSTRWMGELEQQQRAQLGEIGRLAKVVGGVQQQQQRAEIGALVDNLRDLAGFVRRVSDLETNHTEAWVQEVTGLRRQVRVQQNEIVALREEVGVVHQQQQQQQQQQRQQQQQQQQQQQWREQLEAKVRNRTDSLEKRLEKMAEKHERVIREMRRGGERREGGEGGERSNVTRQAKEEERQEEAREGGREQEREEVREGGEEGEREEGRGEGEEGERGEIEDVRREGGGEEGRIELVRQEGGEVEEREERELAMRSELETEGGRGGGRGGEVESANSEAEEEVEEEEEEEEEGGNDEGEGGGRREKRFM